jgi:hypothetical protein
LIRRNLMMTLFALCAAIMLAGCGGGGGTTAPAVPIRSVGGLALAPASLAGRAADPDVPVARATVVLYDITDSVPGITVSTSSTDASGHYHFSGLGTSQIYLALITKQVQNSQGQTVTLSMSGIMPPADSTGNATANVTPSTTVAAGYILAHLAELKANGDDAAHVLQNIIRASDDITVATDTERHGDSPPSIDLTKPANDPASHSDDAQHVVTQTVRSAVFIAPGGNTKGTIADVLFDKTTGQAFLTLVVRDGAGDIFDTDSFVGLVNASGNFSGKTIDGGYTITGNMTPTRVQGKWVAADGKSKGSWIANRPGDVDHEVGYQGMFRGPTGDEKGSWLMYVDNDGAVLIYGRSNKADALHMKNTIVLTGTLDTASTIAAKLSFPAEGGTLSGSDPTKGTMVVTGNTNVSGFFGSVHGTVMGSTSGSAVTGTWKIAGADGANVFDETGTWSGVKY